MAILDKLDDLIGLEYVHEFVQLENRLQEFGASEIRSICEEITQAFPRFKKQNSTDFTFMGNSELSCLPFPCAYPTCRSRAVQKVATFAATYADEFVLFNPLQSEKIAHGDRKSVAKEAAIVISSIIELSPLIERGIITFAEQTTHNICTDCMQKGIEAASNENAKDDDMMYFHILNNYIDSASIIYEGKNDGFHSFEIKGTTDFTGHNTMNYSLKTKKNSPLDLMPSGTEITRDEAIDLGIGHSSAHHLSNDIIDIHDIAVKRNIRNLSSSNAQLDAVSRYFMEGEKQSNLDIAYPLLAAKDLSSILKFRDNEWHHLDDFRKFVSDAVVSGHAPQRAMDSEASKLEKIVKKSQRESSRKLIDGAGIAAMSAIATLATVDVSAMVAATTAVIGTGHFASNMVPEIRKRLSEPEEVRESPIYFGWKLRN